MMGTSSPILMLASLPSLARICGEARMLSLPSLASALKVALKSSLITDAVSPPAAMVPALERPSDVPTAVLYIPSPNFPFRRA